MLLLPAHWLALSSAKREEETKQKGKERLSRRGRREKEEGRQTKEKRKEQLDIH